MLFKQAILEGIATGRVTLAFRRWRKAPPADGSTLRTPVGVVSLDRVTTIEEGDIAPADVRRSGMTVEALRASLQGEGRLLRIELRLVGDDPRVALRERPPDNDEVQAIHARLARFDRATAAPWTGAYLRVIADHPAVVSHRLSPKVGETDLTRFKRRVRQLKELGLTESLEVGYRLSPRGVAVLSALA
jgi:hypothetical protein